MTRLKHISSQHQAKKLNYESLDLWSIVNANNKAKATLSVNMEDKNKSITLVTQISMDRLVSLERSLATWTGPVSIAIYVPIGNVTSTTFSSKDNDHNKLRDWHHLYIHKKISSLNLSVVHLNISSILIVPYPENLEYPINQLRNLAIDKVLTRWMFLVDSDFQSSPNLMQNVMPYLPSSPVDKLYAFVVPAFEYLETPNKDDPTIESKDELIELIHREDHHSLQPFRQMESMESHALTDYARWYTTNVPYNLTTQFHDKYEPYIIVEKRSELPNYRPQLTNYGMNKVLHASELFAAGYQFQVLPNVWTIHFPHRTTGYYQAFRQNLDRRLLNRAQRFEVIEEIIARYNWTNSLHFCQSITPDCQ